MTNDVKEKTIEHETEQDETKEQEVLVVNFLRGLMHLRTGVQNFVIEVIGSNSNSFSPTSTVEPEKLKEFQKEIEKGIDIIFSGDSLKVAVTAITNEMTRAFTEEFLTNKKKE